jgi:putative transposase
MYAKRPGSVVFGNGITGNLIRDQADFQRHVDYVHENPLKHGLVKRVADWPYSTFHHYVSQGTYPAAFCGDAAGVVPGDAWSIR